jgi:peptidyl-tRNA hydrolase
VTGYVLSRANAEQERLIFSALDRALAVLPDLLDGDLADAMKELHTMNEDGTGANGL